MLRRHLAAALAFALAAALIVALPPAAQAQLRKLKVVSSDSVPIVYAYVTSNGGTGQITDEKGEISFGAGKRNTLSVSIRRIGYQPWFGKLELPDTAAVLTVTLPRIAQTLGEVRISGYSSASTLSLPMKGFYDRWTMRQEGLLSATFIGPEEIEFRHPNRITNMLSGLNGVTLMHNAQGEQVAFGYGGMCKMTILVDGLPQCPLRGCHCSNCGPFAPGDRDRVQLDEGSSVLIDRVVDAASVSAIEVYARGGNMPVSLQVSDPACGVIAFWTGSRKP
jgi:hypothetical protein